jgi:hypothetical protein
MSGSGRGKKRQELALFLKKDVVQKVPFLRDADDVMISMLAEHEQLHGL